MHTSFEEQEAQQREEMQKFVNDSLWIRNFLTLTAAGLAVITFDGPSLDIFKSIAMVLGTAAMVFAYLEHLTATRLVNGTVTLGDTKFLRTSHLPSFMFRLPLHKLLRPKSKEGK